MDFKLNILGEFFMKTSKTVASYLQSLTFTSSKENQLIDHALHQLELKQDETKVLSELCANLRLLAVKQQISKEGFELFTMLQKPNFGNDFGRTIKLWF